MGGGPFDRGRRVYSLRQEKQCHQFYRSPRRVPAEKFPLTKASISLTKASSSVWLSLSLAVASSSFFSSSSFSS